MKNRQEFLNELSARMAGLPESERARLNDYFAEMIDDRIEMGMSEYDAVAALGDPAELLRDILPATPTLPVSTADAGDGQWREAIHEIHVHLKSADGKIMRGPLPDGVSAQINASESGVFTWNLADGVLTVTETGETRRGLFHRDRRVTLVLADFAPEKLIVDSYGGDIDIRDVQVADLLVTSTSSGDIKLDRARCGGRAEATSRSGDIDLRDFSAQGVCKLETLSGDAELDRVTADSLRVRTASGDIELTSVRASNVALGAVSGDIEISAVEAETLLCETTSGDIQLSRVLAADTRLSSVSGDLTARLFSPSGESPLTGYDVKAFSQSGDVEINNLPAPGLRPGAVNARTVSGDIEISVL